jgi:hypothetical protein
MTITSADVTVRATGPMLPEAFADLERFAERWCHDTEAKRYEVRLASTMDELQDLYDTALPRAEAAMEHLDQFDLYDLPERELNLLRLLFALIVVTFPVEAFRQPKVPDTGTTYLSKTIDPGP